MRGHAHQAQPIVEIIALLETRSVERAEAERKIMSIILIETERSPANAPFRLDL